MQVETDAVVIGGGQAGLATSHELTRAGIDHVVLERDRVGSSWAGLWDSFRVNTPNWGTRLPGMPYDGGDPDGFMSRGEIVSHLARYRTVVAAPVREGVEVTDVERTGGGYVLSTSAGTIDARSVVVCTGAYQRLFTPSGAEGLPPHLVTLDTRSYSNPDALPHGAVLVVGSGQSGCQIAEELCEAGREVILSCGKAPYLPRRIGDHDLLWWGLETGFLDLPVESLAVPQARLGANLTASGVGGGHDLHPRTLRRKGATLTGRFVGTDRDGLAFEDDLGATIAWDDDRYREFAGRVEALCDERGIARPALPEPDPFDPAAPTSIDARAVSTVILSGGFRPDYSWIRVPGAFDRWGFPVHVEGESTAAPGLFFVGVHFLRKRRSSLLCGVGEDTAVVAGGIVRFLA